MIRPSQLCQESKQHGRSWAGEETRDDSVDGPSAHARRLVADVRVMRQRCHDLIRQSGQARYRAVTVRRQVRRTLQRLLEIRRQQASIGSRGRGASRPGGGSRSGPATPSS
ncbi:hypothetical protein Plo01_66680 [Planobispora longispora]|uniref:Uncharacterized protein n=1 Tax=Planobispora longispora TaxID=28887 RepID=A0A8J3W837_9ACTN|nr:hypothetical protein GCM10020093_013880 [Planobispora longispora]GIH80239.1 hypothetical protein Plo01_66680 [Planobispora longispora]